MRVSTGAASPQRQRVGDSDATEKHVVPQCEITHPALLNLDPSTSFLYAPHTLSVMAIGDVTAAARPALTTT
jgi:hypothetical protein